MLEKMDQFFEKRLEGYEEHMLSGIEGAGEFYSFTAGLLPASGRSEVLDLGCGTGLELKEYFLRSPEARVTGIDLSEAMLGALAEQFPDRCADGRLRLICGSYFDVPFGTERYDAAVSVESLHHFTPEQKLPLYRKLRQSLKESGFFHPDRLFRGVEGAGGGIFPGAGTAEAGAEHYGRRLLPLRYPADGEHETEVLREAGFSDVRILKNWAATYTVRAVR